MLPVSASITLLCNLQLCLDDLVLTVTTIGVMSAIPNLFFNKDVRGYISDFFGGRFERAILFHNHDKRSENVGRPLYLSYCSREHDQ
ncbi:hypothetical protein PsW64_01438 [Pseudovibrio sp. W64]|nr:hypothetical protein PsW64_01438 [Pseudovibrio sp. W64]